MFVSISEYLTVYHNVLTLMTVSKALEKSTEKHLPWISKSIKLQMKKRKSLYDKAKHIILQCIVWGCAVAPPVLYQPYGCLTQ